ncbi:MAG: hypothetical protein FWF29_00300 [Treponema sp.]|nr:hypothetical protein [Treponema sp.]
METTTQDSPRALTFDDVWKAIMEDRENMKMQDERWAIERKEREIEREKERKEREIKEEKEKKESERELIEFRKKMAELSDRFGELAEHLVAPSIMEKFNDLGYDFDRISNNVKIKRSKGAFSDAQIDLMLENGDIVIAVEVKAKPREDDIDDHIHRMEVLRREADRKQDKRIYVGAIAGAIIGEAVSRYIIKKGFYLIEQSGDTMKITVPAGFKPREW